MNALTIGVVGAAGGIGTSTLAAGLVRRAVVAGSTGVCVDGRWLGGGLDVIVGAEREPGLRWPDLAQLQGTVPGAELLARLPRVDDVPVLAHGRDRAASPAPESCASVVACLAGAADVVVVDLPRPSEDAFQAYLPVLGPVLVVAGHTIPALASCAAVAPWAEAASGRGWLCQRVRRTGSRLGESVAAAVGLPLLGVVPDDRAVLTDLARGRPPGSGSGPFAQACDDVLARLTTAPRGMS